MTAAGGLRSGVPLQAAAAAGTDRRAIGRRWHDLGLRARATFALAVVALVLSVVVGGAVWVTVSGFLITKRTQAAVAQTRSNVEQVRRGLGSPGVSPPQLLAQLPREIGSSSLLLSDGRWWTTSLQVNRDLLPPALKSSATAGQPVYQRLRSERGPQLVVGLPLADKGSAYFEVFALTELDQTLRTLSTALVIAMVSVPLVGLLLGRWALRPAFRPLDRVAAAATAIAGGDLGARIDPRGDPGLRSIADSFNETAARLERRVRADARFAADVSHELRSPLTTMLTAVELFEASRQDLGPEGREALDLLRGEVRRFERLVADLLEISRADAGSADVVLEVVTLSEFVTRTLPISQRDRLVVEPTSRVPVRVDKRRLERVISNLVDNAERHGRGLTAVRVRARPPWAEVVVEDHGPGVDQSERERVFDRFARGRRTGRDGGDGAGLGLSLVARHVALMGGHVRVENLDGGGARFVVTLPTQPEPGEGA